jgi:hypothetical protein
MLPDTFAASAAAFVANIREARPPDKKRRAKSIFIGYKAKPALAKWFEIFRSTHQTND